MNWPFWKDFATALGLCLAAYGTFFGTILGIAAALGADVIDPARWVIAIGVTLSLCLAFFAAEWNNRP